jgi:LAO/AO transport system kinase
VAALRDRWENVSGHDDLDALAEAVVAGEKDPYAAADELVASSTG